ncbi:hypothetical protein M422DRAFT_247767 [Sphaerobolus stellatus SS14]|nr:hypothetical protein M422DRAFT_247767 [Sphaerobolus stellatus SS14]
MSPEAIKVIAEEVGLKLQPESTFTPPHGEDERKDGMWEVQYALSEGVKMRIVWKRKLSADGKARSTVADVVEPEASNNGRLLPSHALSSAFKEDLAKTKLSFVEIHEWEVVSWVIETSTDPDAITLAAHMAREISCPNDRILQFSTNQAEACYMAILHFYGIGQYPSVYGFNLEPSESSLIGEPSPLWLDNAYIKIRHLEFDPATLVVPEMVLDNSLTLNINQNFTNEL